MKMGCKEKLMGLGCKNVYYLHQVVVVVVVVVVIVVVVTRGKACLCLRSCADEANLVLNPALLLLLLSLLLSLLLLLSLFLLLF